LTVLQAITQMTCRPVTNSRNIQPYYYRTDIWIQQVTASPAYYSARWQTLIQTFRLLTLSHICVNFVSVYLPPAAISQGGIWQWLCVMSRSDGDRRRGRISVAR